MRLRPTQPSLQGCCVQQKGCPALLPDRDILYPIPGENASPSGKISKGSPAGERKGTSGFLHKIDAPILAGAGEGYGKEVVAIPSRIMYNCTKALLAEEPFCVEIA